MLPRNPKAESLSKTNHILCRTLPGTGTAAFPRGAHLRAVTVTQHPSCSKLNLPAREQRETCYNQEELWSNTSSLLLLNAQTHGKHIHCSIRSTCSFKISS